MKAAVGRDYGNVRVEDIDIGGVATDGSGSSVDLAQAVVNEIRGAGGAANVNTADVSVRAEAEALISI